MEFSRAVALACFTALKWLMLVSAALFAALALKQQFGAAAVSLAFALGGGVASLAVAGLFAYLAKRISA